MTKTKTKKSSMTTSELGPATVELHVNNAMLDLTRWVRAPVDILHSVYNDGTQVPERMGELDTALYQPTNRIPRAVFARLSDSEKRLDQELSIREVSYHRWGSICEVLGGGALIGAFVFTHMGCFEHAHVLPDGAHFSMGSRVPAMADPFVKDLYTNKSFRVFETTDGVDVSDVVVVTKQRWFRNRNNPKFLGFSKDERA